MYDIHSLYVLINNFTKSLLLYFRLLIYHVYVFTSIIITLLKILNSTLGLYKIKDQLKIYINHLTLDFVKTFG